MTPQDINKLNSLQSNPSAQLNLLVGWYKNQRILISDLMAQASIGLNISPDMVNRFAIKLHAGSDGLIQNQELGLQLYIYAGEKGSLWGKANAGCELIYGVGSIKPDLPKAIIFLNEAIARFKATNQSASFAHYWLGVALCHTGDYKKATAAFKQVKEDDKDRYPKAIQAIKDMHSKALLGMYAGADRRTKIPTFASLATFAVAINDYYTNLAAEYPTLVKAMSPDRNDHKETIKKYYRGLILLYRALVEKFPTRKRYYQKNLNQLEGQISKAIGEIEPVDLVLVLEDKGAVAQIPIETKKETTSSDGIPVAAKAAISTPSALAAQMSLAPPIAAPLLPEKKSSEEVAESIVVSFALDGYDSSKAMHLSTVEVESASINQECMLRTSSMAYAHIKEAKIEGVGIEMLNKKYSDITVAMEAARDKYAVAKKSHQELLDGAEHKEFQRQITTERRFFSPHRTGSLLTRDMAVKLQTNRCAEKLEEVKAINVSGVPARRAITAERSTNEASLRLFGHATSWYGTQLGSRVVRTESKRGYSSSQSNYGNLEEVILGSTTVRYEHRTDPAFNHRGDFYKHQLGAYSQIITVLDRITGYIKTDDKEMVQVEKEKALAKLMLEYSRTGKAITSGDLELVDMHTEVSAEDIHSLNRILYHCLVKEIARWQLPKDRETHELPWATAQIRAVKLIAMGHLTMREVFAQDAPYGVFTGTNIDENIDQVKEKMKAITRLYIEAYLKQKGEGLDKHVAFFKTHKKGELVTTRLQLRTDLGEYGANSDTDGEGYDSDTAKQEGLQ